MVTLGAPLALLGLAALVPLTLIYILHRVARRVEVSSLLLWQGSRRPSVGGRRVERLRTPLAYALEALTLVLLALAAAGPLLRTGSGSTTLVIVADNSLSMSARGADGRTALERAKEAAARMARGEERVRLVLAGPRAAPAPEGAGFEAVAAAWDASAPNADLASAVALARDIGGARARLAVFTDVDPARAGVDLAREPEVRWLAFGEARENSGIVNAVRGAGGVIVEVERFGGARGGRTVRLSEEGADGAWVERGAREVMLAPGERARLRFPMDASGRALRLTIGEDALAVDNDAVLAPLASRPVRVGVEIGDERLAGAVRGAVEASGIGVVVGAGAEVVFADAETARDRGRWVVRFERAGADARSYAAPFTVDSVHALGEGLDLSGVVWAAGASERVGAPVVLAGDAALVEDRSDERGGLAWVRLDAERSNLLERTAWPVLVWNALAWRRSALPGLARENIALGQLASFRVEGDEAEVEFDAPGRAKEAVSVIDGVAVLEATRTGLHAARAGDVMQRFSVLAVGHGEGDLTKATTAEAGEWSAGAARAAGFTPVSWALLLGALGALAAHAVLLRPVRAAQGGRA